MEFVETNNRPYRSGPKWTLIFIGIAIAGFIIQFITGPGIWQYFAFIPEHAITRPWTFITTIFLHADINHLFFNMFMLFAFGINLERLLGKNKFLIIFLVSGILGNIGYWITTGNYSIPAIGASGAVYGLMGTLAILAPFMKFYVWGLVPVPMIVLTALYAIGDIFGLFTPSNIAHGAHIAGLIAGIAFGIYLRPFFGYRRRNKDIEL